MFPHLFVHRDFLDFCCTQIRHLIGLLVELSEDTNTIFAEMVTDVPRRNGYRCECKLIQKQFRM